MFWDLVYSFWRLVGFGWVEAAFVAALSAVSSVVIVSARRRMAWSLDALDSWPRHLVFVVVADDAFVAALLLHCPCPWLWSKHSWGDLLHLLECSWEVQPSQRSSFAS